ncbi:MAG: hypothetical protein GF393_13025, partial [Armatimonadia bacterium]|nr:hypothetical protein [Armatimonadia bacterium]
MVKRPFLALCIIICGLLLIIAGLGYTVNQASEYSTRSSPDPTALDYDTLPTRVDRSQRFHPSVGSEPVSGQNITVPRRVEVARDFEKPSFVFPALSL